MPTVARSLITRAFALVLSLTPFMAHSAEEIVVYSARTEPLIKPLFDEYAKSSAVKIKFVTAEAGPLLQRLKAEGKNTPADLLITVDAGNLWQAKQEGLLQPVESKVLTDNIPAHLRDPDNQWFGLSIRARTIVYNTKKLKPADLPTYEGLADAKWKGKLCLRTAKKVYNQSLVAMLIAQKGEAEAEKIVKGWVANLAAPVFSNDVQVMDAIAAGQCDVGLVNTYYFGRLITKKPQLPLALFWPNQESTGVHVNISGAGVVKNAKHPKQAQALLEWMSSGKAQEVIAGSNLEFPANPAVKPDPLVAGWGPFKQNTLNVSQAGQLQAAAIKLMDRAGYH
ncbi:MAG: Fe(3+) ABC transporter substrate-binding protein [Methylococcaceae bacterium]|nr:Fe(3+) ABC transporter substrate-binding protein [Methylococcaceae bacterium]